VLALSSLFVMYAFASEVPSTIPTVSPAFVGVSAVQPTLYISATPIAYCHDFISISNGYSASAAWTLQYKSDTSENSWATFKTWSSSGSGSIGLNKNVYVTSGRTYRLKVAASVYDSQGNLVDSITGYSSKVSC
jgi:hypothetical protein